LRLSKGISEHQLLILLKRTLRPVSVEYVAVHLNIGWGTARAILLELALSGKVVGQKTTKSWIFWIPEGEDIRTNKGGS